LLLCTLKLGQDAPNGIALQEDSAYVRDQISFSFPMDTIMFSRKIMARMRAVVAE
jgi:hypothetical protein